MTSRERIEAALSHREPDRTPVFEYVMLAPLADTLLGRPYTPDKAHWPDALREMGWPCAVRQAAADRLDLAELLGHDMMYVTPSPPPSDSAPPPAPDPGDPVERMRLRNEIATAKPAPSDDFFRVYAELKEQMAARGLDLPMLAPACAHGVWTDVDLMQTMLLAPDVAHRHFELRTEQALARVDGYVNSGVDMVMVGGDFAGTRPLISPAAYRDFIVPEVRKVSRRIHALGRVAVNASDGDLWSVIDDFLFGCEVDGYTEIDMHAGMAMDKIKPLCRGRITLFGNLDCGNVLSFGSPDDVRAHVIACLEAGAGDGGHVLCASNAITAAVPLENYLALANAYRDTFGLPRFGAGR